MSTERQSFGFNSFLPTNYKTKAEAFARCLQDKLRLLGCPDEPTENGHDCILPDTPKSTHSDLSQFSEQEIAENVFLQGPLSYKRRSIPEKSSKPLTNGKGKYVVSVGDRRGFSSDSEDSDADDIVPAMQEAPIIQNNIPQRRLASMNSVDSSSSWCSCEEGDNNEDEEDAADGLALQIRGSPTIHNPRLRKFKRKGRDESNKNVKTEKQSSVQDPELFFDFDTECFSPVNLADEDDGVNGFEPIEPSERLSEMVEDTGQADEESVTLDILTPPPSPTSSTLRQNIENDTTNADISPDSQGNISQEDVPEEISDKSVGSNCDEDSLGREETEDHHDLDHDHLDENRETADDTLLEKEDINRELDLNDKIIDDNKSTENFECDIKIDDCEDGSGNAASEEAVDVRNDNNNVNDNDKSFNHSIVVTDCNDTEIDPNYLPPPRMKLRRCSSLKTWKTPPGTPGRKKFVRFADALGLDLADIRTFLDEIPKIPNSAYDDLHYELPSTTTPPPPPERTLIPMFQQPNSSMDFMQRVRQANVSLESAILTDSALLGISGIIRVRNLDFHKTVHVRYSKDNWATYSDLQATYMPNSSDGVCDNFSFTIYGHTLKIGDRLEFAIRYQCSAGQFWDSNGGINYCFQCMPRSSTPFFPTLGSSPVDTWTKFY